jgi:hypothetical protein
LGLCMALEEEGVVQIAMTPFHWMSLHLCQIPD